MHAADSFWWPIWRPVRPAQLPVSGTSQDLAENKEEASLTCLCFPFSILAVSMRTWNGCLLVHLMTTKLTQWHRFKMGSWLKFIGEERVTTWGIHFFLRRLSKRHLGFMWYNGSIKCTAIRLLRKTSASLTFYGDSLKKTKTNLFIPPFFLKCTPGGVYIPCSYSHARWELP